MSTIDDLIASLTQRLRHAERAKVFFADDPALCDEVARTIGTVPLLGPAATGPYPNRQMTAWQKVEKHFKGNNNEWTTLKDLAKATGVAHSVLSGSLCHTHKHLLEYQNDPRGFGPPVWRLRINS